MSNPEAARAFLIGEIEALEPFDCVVVATVGQMLQATEVTRREDGALEVRVPGRPTPLPALTAAEREALNARGFESSAPEDPVVSWTHEAESAEQAVDLLQEVRVTVFGAKPDAPIDIAHGSHRLEHVGPVRDFERPVGVAHDGPPGLLEQDGGLGADLARRPGDEDGPARAHFDQAEPSATGARSRSGSHQAALAAYQSMVSAMPSSHAMVGSQPSSRLIFDQSRT